MLALCCGGAAIAVAVMGADGGDPSAEQPADDGQAEGDTRMPGIGNPARDGSFEFTVTEIETGVDSVGDEFLGEAAQGQFVLVHVTVENIGDDAQVFDGADQALIDTEDREHSADTEAGTYVESAESFLNEINPGNQVDGIVVFDIPADAEPDVLRLHDSPFSGGVDVDVRTS